jgi:pilus assembly protein CpaB
VIARRLTLALVVALAISGLFTFWLSRRVAKPAPPSPAKTRYVAAGRALEAGELLKAQSLTLVDWPSNMPLQGGFVKAEDIVGRAILYPLAPNQPILERDLAAPGAGVGLTGRIPEGMRAISLRSDEIVGVAGFLLPGTHVDVLVTYHTDKSAETLTGTVLQDVEVLAAGQKFQPDPEGKPSSVNVVTLLLAPEDAEKVVLASSQGSIHFVLRNGADREKVRQEPIGLSQLGGAPPAHAEPAVGMHPAAPKAKSYTVETILGTKQSTEVFN